MTSTPPDPPSRPSPSDVDGAVARTHQWFEANSGWAPPDAVTLAEWWADGVCRCPDECLVDPEGICPHGLASWWLVLTSVRRTGPPDHWDPALLLPHPDRLDMGDRRTPARLEAHEDAVARGDAGYLDPGTGLFVLTARYLWDRGCCEQGCRHCPFFAGN